jgi:hypothetical protein
MSVAGVCGGGIGGGYGSADKTGTGNGHEGGEDYELKNRNS